MGECLVCRELSGEIDLPGGFLWDDGEAVAFHLPPLDGNEHPYLGHCLVVTRRHVDHLSDLTATEAASVAAASRKIAAALRAEGVGASPRGRDRSWRTAFPPAPLPALSGRSSRN